MSFNEGCPAEFTGRCSSLLTYLLAYLLTYSFTIMLLSWVFHDWESTAFCHRPPYCM